MLVGRDLEDEGFLGHGGGVETDNEEPDPSMTTCPPGCSHEPHVSG